MRTLEFLRLLFVIGAVHVGLRPRRAARVVYWLDPSRLLPPGLSSGPSSFGVGLAGPVFF